MAPNQLSHISNNKSVFLENWSVFLEIKVFVQKQFSIIILYEIFVSVKYGKFFIYLIFNCEIKKATLGFLEFLKYSLKETFLSSSVKFIFKCMVDYKYMSYLMT